MAAIRPPWVTKTEFYRLPFNFCDRWCERCDLTSICKVYKEGERDRKRAIREGKDPNSMEFAFEVMHRNFQKTIHLLRKGARKWGIDMAQIEKDVQEEMKKEDWRKPPPYTSHPLYQTAVTFSKRIDGLLKELEVVPSEADTARVKERVEVLSWYRPFIVAKIARALSREPEDDPDLAEIEEEDARNSAFLACFALEQMSVSLVDLARDRTLHLLNSRCRRLLKVCQDLSDLLEKSFDLTPVSRPT